MALVPSAKDAGGDGSGLRQIMQLRKELRDETDAEHAVAKIEQTVPKVMTELRHRLQRSADDLSEAIKKQAGPEIEEVRRSTAALLRAEKRMAERVEEITRSDASVQRKMKRVDREVKDFQETIVELSSGIAEFEQNVRAVKSLSDEQQAALLARGHGALFAGLGMASGPKLLDKPQDKTNHNHDRSRTRRRSRGRDDADAKRHRKDRDRDA